MLTAKSSAVVKVLAGALIALSSTQALANTIRLGQPNYGGSGCPAGTASVTLSPDQKSLSVLFDQYMVEAGQFAGKRLDRKSCNLAIPVHVPNGYSISIIQVDYRGFADIPRGGRGQFNVEYFFAGSRGPSQTKNFVGPTSREYALTDRLEAHAMVWSPCGASPNLRVNTSMLAQTNSRFDDALMTLDSADVKAGLVYHIQLRRCR